MADVTANGVRLHYQRMGKEGAAVRVVFIHGLVMDNLSSWYFSVAPGVAQEADVLLLDLRGHGRSERPRAAYAVGDFIGDIVAVIDHALGPGPVVLVGNSFGAQLALRLALAEPTRVAKLILVDGDLGTSGFGERMAGTLSLRGEEADRAIAATFQSWLGRHSERKRTRLGDHARALVMETSLVRDLEATPTLTSRSASQVACPTLLLYGAESDVLEASRPIAAAMPNAILRIFAGCSHSLLWEATNELREVIREECTR